METDPLYSIVEPSATRPTRRFCTQCGQTLEELGHCAACQPAEDSPTSSESIRDHRPTWRATLAMYFCLLGLLVIHIACLSSHPEAEGAYDFWFSIIFSFIVVLFLAFHPRTAWSILSKFCSWEWFLVSLGLSVVSFYGSVVYVNWINSYVPNVSDMSYSQPLLDAGFSWLIVVLIVSIQPGVFEELAFRGVAWSGMERILSTRETAIVTTLMFTILHLQVLNFPNLIFVSLLISFVRIHARSIYPCILLHASHNALVLASEYWPGMLHYLPGA